MARNVAIIGAGMAGLAAARSLTQAGHNITLYEKSRGVGGRVATRRIENCIVDHGAQNIKPQNLALHDVMLHDLPTDDLVTIVPPVRLYTNDGQIWPADPDRNADTKYSYRQGMTTLPKLLLAALPAKRAVIRYETRITRLEETANEVILRDENGQETGRADIVIVTAPAPQAADLLGDSAPFLRSTWEALDRVKALRQVEYHRNITVLLGYAPPAPPAPAYALLADDRAADLLWLAFEQTKAPERAPNGEAVLIAQMGPKFSKFCYEEDDAMLVGRTLNELRPLFGDTYDSPVWTQVKRWKFSQPHGMVHFEEVNFAGMSSSVIVCGDALRPEGGRVSQAYASGLEAADLAQQM
jgi:renalase